MTEEKMGDAQESGLVQQLAEAEARVARIKRRIAAASCGEVGHDWRFVGCAPCACEPGGGHSIPVHECAKCGENDYGENDEADDVRRELCDLTQTEDAGKS